MHNKMIPQLRSYCNKKSIWTACKIGVSAMLLSSFCNTMVLANEKPLKKVNGLVTTADRSNDLKSISFKPTSATGATSTINIDRNARFQQIDGFGTAITGSTCYNLMQMDKKARTKFLKETFSDKTGFGHSYIRISIGASDFSLDEYTLCDKEGLENFALQEEELEYVIPILKEILAINPSIKILGSPWTSPQWMKVDNLVNLQPFPSWTSGHLNPAYYEDYGTYFVKWINAFKDKGIDIYAITPQNEPLNRGNSVSLFMGWNEQRDFLKMGLGPKLKEAGLNTKIYAFDHNYNYDNMPEQQQYPLKIYADDLAAQYTTGTAYHSYGGHYRELARIHEARPDKELLFTEASIGTWNNGRDLDKRLTLDMEELGLGTVNNWCKGVILWNLMLDSERGPWRDGGCKTCYGAVDIDKKDYKTITRNSHYYVISHLASVVKPGAVRIGNSGLNTEGLIYSTFENPDGSIALVLTNKSDKEQKVAVSDGKNNFEYVVLPKSVNSFSWAG